MKPIIEVKNISKRYDITHSRGGYVPLSEVITNIFKHPFRFLKKKATQPFKKKEDFWALDDINLTINKGEIVGIIGANGAGKSTLLKILSRVTPPTKGEIKLKGKVSSLLEIGTGFHPELTGRENIFLNGAILGMSRKEVVRKFGDIVEFSGVEKFIDTPVKRYSSGMYVRLAFSVAAHMEPDILLVDEVLAVGDAEFQKKCLGKMDEVTKTAGRTILFVSHNMNAVRKLCSRTVLLEDGKIAMIGNTQKVVERYLNRDFRSEAEITYPEDTKKKVQIKKISVLDSSNKPNTQIDINQPFGIEVEYSLGEDLVQRNIVELLINDINGNTILQIMDVDTNEPFFSRREKGTYVSRFNFPSQLFNEQSCKFRVFCGEPDSHNLWDQKENIDINFVNYADFPSKFFIGRGGSFLLKIPSEISKKTPGL